MNPPPTMYAVLQVIAVFLIFFSAFLALLLGVILCVVAAEFARVGASFVRTRIVKVASSRNPASSESKGNAHLAGRRLGVIH